MRTFTKPAPRLFSGPPSRPERRASKVWRLRLIGLFNHANLCPFVGRQLIQRFVTSNPSAAYTGRVAAACVNNGQGVRGDMKAMVRAILLDTEARDASKIADPQFGKVREPAVRLANWARCFKATSTSGNWTIRNLDSAVYLARPAAVARGVGVQFLPPRLRAAEHCDRRGRTCGARVSADRRNRGSRIHQLHAGCRAIRRRHRHPA